MKNFVQPGKVWNVTLTADTPSGRLIRIGSGNMFGVAVVGGKAGEVAAVNVSGVYTLTKASGLVLAQGDRVLYDTSTNTIVAWSGSPTGTQFAAGWAFSAAGAGTTSVDVFLSHDIQ